MKRAICWLGVVLGALGAALCAVGLVGVWIYYARLTDKTQDIYARIDEALGHAGDRIGVVRQRVVTVNAMTGDFRASLKEWVNTKQLDRDRVGHRAELITARLHQVRNGLDLAESFLQNVRSAKRLAHPFRKQTDTQQIDGLLEELGKLQVHVSGVVDSVDEIRERAEQSGDEAQLEETIEHAMGEVVRVIELIESADEGLQKLSGKVSDVRSKAADLELRIQRDLWWGRLTAFVVLPWMALGQVALCVLARSRV